MITENEYLKSVKEVLEIDINDNSAQKEAILSPITENQYIVAGPGSGKTTVLVLKVLKYLLVDEIKLEEIIITTFTKKAANGIIERIEKWSKKIIEHLKLNLTISYENVMIGTLDSISEEIVSKYHTFEVIDNFTSSALMMQTLLTDDRNNDKRLKQFFKKLTNNTGGTSTSSMNRLIQSLRQRMAYDMVDRKIMEENVGREKLLYEIISDYEDQLIERDVLDYVMLEKKFHELLSQTRIKCLENVKVLLIDEYQDTNYLQEQIYFKIAEYTKNNNGNMTVVGDDDQSLYRFRGATISLFTDYVNRVSSIGIEAKTIYLHKNYRSTDNIVDFSNEYIHVDEVYQNSRTTNKPDIITGTQRKDNLPVMGLFRNNMAELSTDLSNLLYDLKLGRKVEVTRNDKKYEITTKTSNPSIAVLTNSPKEISAYNKKRLPYYIRENLSYKDENIAVYNPRGQSIETTEIVSFICGLILTSIDKEEKLEKQLENIPPKTKKTLKQWRKQATEYLEQENKEIQTHTQTLDINELLNPIKDECTPLLNQSNENQIYYEIIMDIITQTNNAINIEGKLSTQQIFWHIIIPVASGAIEIDEDIFDVDLNENINIMSIHQAKGLEFDIVIVDIGSDITNNNKATAFMRFPTNGGTTHNIETYMQEASPLKKDYTQTTGKDDAFNDLIRKYYVAYTRARSILILVGLNSMRYGIKGDFQDKIPIENMAVGWTRNKTWKWEELNNLLQI